MESEENTSLFVEGKTHSHVDARYIKNAIKTCLTGRLCEYPFIPETNI